MSDRELLRDQGVATAFYDQRYSRGYMDDWPREKKQRVFALVRSLALPPSGLALDYGCGNGVFTEVLRSALGPGWQVVGSDVSTVALANARERFPNCQFVQFGDLAGRQFDFFFSHHVLEHVSDLDVALADLDGVTLPEACGLHILPSGNHGSLEHSIALLRRDGIDPRVGYRFFHDDEGHLRRLRTEELRVRYEALGYSLVEEHYAGQFFAALDWMSGLGAERPMAMTEPAAATGRVAMAKLVVLRAALLVLWAARRPAVMIPEKFAKPHWTFRDWLLVTVGLTLYPMSAGVDRWLKRSVAREWEQRHHDGRASEMYLVFRRRRLVPS